MAMNWLKHVVWYWLEYTFSYHLVVLLTTLHHIYFLHAQRGWHCLRLAVCCNWQSPLLKYLILFINDLNGAADNYHQLLLWDTVITDMLKKEVWRQTELIIQKHVKRHTSQETGRKVLGNYNKLTNEEPISNVTMLPAQNPQRSVSFVHNSATISFSKPLHA